MQSMNTLRIPRCLACRNPLAAPLEIPRTFTVQTRGKKKLRRPISIIVRLLQDKAHYGPKGAIIPIPAGLMRNKWFPNQIAQYMTSTELKNIDIRAAELERDYSFVASKQDPVVVDTRPDVVDIKLHIPSAPETSKVLESLLPDTFTFILMPISSSKTKDGVPNHSPIFGSVTTAEMLQAIKAICAEDAKASSLVLYADDIKFSAVPGSVEVEAERIKRLGDFYVDIEPKGAGQKVRRMVKVVPPEIGV
ncbi:MAG: hypothetical protein M1829_006097 [Trizodia sp. TS-e1964]|nr:MAG: hypothetical protein M1829_006097 [Trizodia sp. TS-e1964]